MVCSDERGRGSSFLSIVWLDGCSPSQGAHAKFLLIREGVYLEHIRRYLRKRSNADAIFVSGATKREAGHSKDVLGPLVQRSRGGRLEWDTLFATSRTGSKLALSTLSSKVGPEGGASFKLWLENTAPAR